MEKPLNAVGAIYLVSVTGNKSSHTEGKCVNCHGLTELWFLSLTHSILLPVAGVASFLDV